MSNDVQTTSFISIRNHTKALIAELIGTCALVLVGVAGLPVSRMHVLPLPAYGAAEGEVRLEHLVRVAQRGDAVDVMLVVAFHSIYAQSATKLPSPAPGEGLGERVRRLNSATLISS